MDGENYAAAWPTVIYGVVLLFAAIAYFILARTFISVHGVDSSLAQTLGYNHKNTVSALLYAAAIPLAFVHTAIADALYVIVAIMWLVADRRIEKNIAQ